jgi:hypothetical protein
VFSRTTVVDPPLAVVDPPVQGPACTDPLATDASLGVTRTAGGEVRGYVLADATVLACASLVLVKIEDGPATLAYDGSNVHISRPDAHFRILAQGVSGVFHRGVRLPTVLDGGYWTNALYTGVRPAPAAPDLELRAFPNPFNPSVRITFVVPSRGDVRAEIHDAAGRRVVVLAARVMEAGAHALQWNGRDESGRAAASGVYFLRVRSGAAARSIKLVLLR